MLDERMARVESALQNIERIVHGPPPLEERMREYADGRAAHKANGAAQIAQNVRHLLEIEQEKRDKQHDDNTGQFRQLFRLVYIGVGIVITLQVILLALVKH